MTTQKKGLIAAAVVIWIMLGLQIAAEVWFLYWVLPWFDILMHTLGGIWLGLIMFTIMARHVKFVIEHPLSLFLVMIGGTLFVGFMWELMEFIIDIFLGTNRFQPNLPDTMSDLAFDLLGSVIAFGFIRYFMKRTYHVSA